MPPGIPESPVHPPERGAGPLRVTAAATGFALSVGWYWFPSMHPLWLGDILQTVAPDDTVGLFEMMMLFLTIKSVTILAFGFLLRNAALDVLFRLGNKLVESPFRERLTLLFPLLVLHLFACLALFPLLASERHSDQILSLAPVFLGVSEIIFSLIWFTTFSYLPGVRCCMAYGLGALGSLGLYCLMISLPPAMGDLLRGLAPVLACPLLFFALPSSSTIKGFRFKYDFLRAARTDPALANAVPPPPYFVFFAFAVTSSLPMLLNVTESGFLFSQSHRHLAPMQSVLALSGQACGGFLAALFMHKHRSLWVPTLALAFLGGGAVLLPLLGTGSADPLPTFVFHVATGLSVSFAALLIGAFIRAGRPLVSTVSCGLFLYNFVSGFGGYALWLTATSILTPMTHQQVYLQLLGLVCLLSILPFYALRQPLHRILGAEHPIPEILPPKPAEKPLALTNREREIARMVQTGMKNLEISSQLNIADTTLRVHLRSIYRKLGVRGRPNLSAVDLGQEPTKPQSRGNTKK